MFPLLMKPTGGFEGAGEFFKLFFIFALSINALLDSGGEVFGRQDFNSADCHTILSLASQIQKEDSIANLLIFFFFFCRNLGSANNTNKDLEQNPLAPTLMAYRSTSQPLEFVADFNGIF